jgi:Resolvase, N terminal domain
VNPVVPQSVPVRSPVTACRTGEDFPYCYPGRDVSEVRLRNYSLTCGVSVLVSQAEDSNASRLGGGARLGYTRISTISQTLDQQNAALEAAGVTKTFSYTMSGARDDRPGLAALMEYVRVGDAVGVEAGPVRAQTHCTSWRPSRH